MSGLEPIAALGLACNILQIVDIGHQSIMLAKAVYDGQSPDNALEECAGMLREIVLKIQTAAAPTRHSELKAVMNNCTVAAQDLQEEIRFLMSGSKRGDFVSAIKVAAKTNWRKDRLKRLERSLDKAERLLQSGLLARIWSDVNTVQTDLSKIDDGLRHFIDQYERSNKSTRDLTRAESARTRQHISSASSENQRQIQQHITREVDRSEQDLKSSFGKQLKDFAADIKETSNTVAQSHASEVAKKRLLQSLKPRDLHERRNQVQEAHRNTFRWVLWGDDEHDQNPPFHAQTQPKWDSFCNWLRSTDTVYWVTGKPASGKSTFMKFISEHQRTRECLDIWRPSADILSHYFWKAGSPAQHNFKGLLCSIILQLLFRDESLIHLIVSKFPWARDKDTETDWSVRELCSVCRQAFISHNQPICLFLDGLDEFTDPDYEIDDVFELLDWLVELGNFKMCLSSRPERPQEGRLGSFPQLRLEDLTRDDLLRYARDHLRFPERLPLAYRNSMMNRLVDRAEGVFLWLCLAVKNINKGYLLGDRPEIIQERIDLLPGSLKSMYQELWGRATAENPKEYRRVAALYFKLMLENNAETTVFDLLLSSTSLAHQLLSTSQDDRLGHFEPTPVSTDAILQQHQETERQVAVYSGGLLEIGVANSSPRVYAHRVNGKDYSGLTHLVDGSRKICRFIHRTAYDFLCDSAEGQEILENCTATVFQVRIGLLKARLATCRLFSREMITGLESPNNVSIELLDDADFVFAELSSMRALKSWNQPEADEVLVLCERLLENRMIYFPSPQWMGGKIFPSDGPFFKTLMGAYNPREQHHLSQSSRSRILLKATWWKDYSHHLDMMLEGHADPNWKVCTYPEPYFSAFSILASPFTACLEWALLDQTRCRFADDIATQSAGRHVSEDVPIQLRGLATLLSHGANLQENIGISFQIDDSSGFASLRRFEPLSRLLINSKTCAWDNELKARGENDKQSQNDEWSFGRLGIAVLPAHAAVTVILKVISHRGLFCRPEDAPIQDVLYRLRGEASSFHKRENAQFVFAVKASSFKENYDLEAWEYKEVQEEEKPEKIIEQILSRFYDGETDVSIPFPCWSSAQRIPKKGLYLLPMLRQLGLVY